MIVISVDIDPIFFKLAGNKDMHNIMNEFEFRRDRTTDYGVGCPSASKKYPYRPYNGENGFSTFSLLFLIGSFWYFHVSRTSINAWMSLNFLKWDLTLAHWTQVSDRCPLGYLYVAFWPPFSNTKSVCYCLGIDCRRYIELLKYLSNTQIYTFEFIFSFTLLYVSSLTFTYHILLSL